MLVIIIFRKKNLCIFKVKLEVLGFLSVGSIQYNSYDGVFFFFIIYINYYYYYYYHSNNSYYYYFIKELYVMKNIKEMNLFKMIIIFHTSFRNYFQLYFSFTRSLANSVWNDYIIIITNIIDFKYIIKNLYLY